MMSAYFERGVSITTFFFSFDWVMFLAENIGRNERTDCSSAKKSQLTTPIVEYMIICSFGGYEPTDTYYMQQEHVEDLTIRVGNCWSYTPELLSGTLSR